MKITLKRDDKLIDAKDLTDAEKIGFINGLAKQVNFPVHFRDDHHRIEFADCFFAGANPHTFFNDKKKMLPERIHNACNAADNFTLPKPIN